MQALDQQKNTEDEGDEIIYLLTRAKVKFYSKQGCWEFQILEEKGNVTNAQIVHIANEWTRIGNTSKDSTKRN